MRFRWRVVVWVGLVGSQALADCQYFRTGYKLLKCAEWKEAETSSAAADPIEGGEPLEGITVKVTCSCDYSLSGSVPLCDFDQTVEQSSIRGVEKVRSYCSRGKELCNEVCSRHLP